MERRPALNQTYRDLRHVPLCNRISSTSGSHPECSNSTVAGHAVPILCTSVPANLELVSGDGSSWSACAVARGVRGVRPFRRTRNALGQRLHQWSRTLWAVEAIAQEPSGYTDLPHEVRARERETEHLWIMKRWDCHAMNTGRVLDCNAIDVDRRLDYHCV